MFNETWCCNLVQKKLIGELDGTQTKGNWVTTKMFFFLYRKHLPLQRKFKKYFTQTVLKRNQTLFFLSIYFKFNWTRQFISSNSSKLKQCMVRKSSSSRTVLSRGKQAVSYFLWSWLPLVFTQKLLCHWILKMCVVLYFQESGFFNLFSLTNPSNYVWQKGFCLLSRSKREWMTQNKPTDFYPKTTLELRFVHS